MKKELSGRNSFWNRLAHRASAVGVGLLLTFAAGRSALAQSDRLPDQM